MIDSLEEYKGIYKTMKQRRVIKIGGQVWSDSFCDVYEYAQALEREIELLQEGAITSSLIDRVVKMLKNGEEK